MMGEPLFIRTDADASIGIGHFMRMLALAEAWSGAVVFGGTIALSLARRAHALNASVIPRSESSDDASWTVEQAQRAGAKTVVADGYHFGLAFQQSVKRAGLKLMVVDDNAENVTYEVDWVLNVNLHATESMYLRKSEHTRCLLGPRYALIRRAIREAAQAKPRRRGGTRNLLVTMGGADPVNATGRILDALTQLRPDWRTTVLVGGANPRLQEYEQQLSPGVVLLHDIADVTPVMAEADVALAATGGTIWELGLLGVPSVTLSLADNQVQLAQELHRQGAIDYAGDARGDVDAATWLQRIERLLREPAQREALLAQAQALVDGQGALRVVQHLQGE